MANTASYNNTMVATGEVEYPANDPASGAFFQTDYKRLNVDVIYMKTFVFTNDYNKIYLI